MRAASSARRVFVLLVGWGCGCEGSVVVVVGCTGGDARGDAAEEDDEDPDSSSDFPPAGYSCLSLSLPLYRVCGAAARGWVLRSLFLAEKTDAEPTERRLGFGLWFSDRGGRGVVRAGDGDGEWDFAECEETGLVGVGVVVVGRDRDRDVGSMVVAISDEREGEGWVGLSCVCVRK